jgi:hypothetical protein
MRGDRRTERRVSGAGDHDVIVSHFDVLSLANSARWSKPWRELGRGPFGTSAQTISP